MNFISTIGGYIVLENFLSKTNIVLLLGEIPSNTWLVIRSYCALLNFIIINC